MLFSILLPSKQYKNFINSSLFEFEKATKVFDEILNRNYNLLSYENQVWDEVSNEWNNSIKYVYEYDQSNNQIEFLFQLWNDGVWVNNSNTTYSYNDNNLRDESCTCSWNGEDWENASKSLNFIYQENNLDTGSDTIIDLSYSLNAPFPNPFNPSVTISFLIPNYNFVSIQVYDIRGNLISALVEDYFNQGNHSLIWNAQDFPSGQYIIKMESGNFNKTQIISLIK